MVIRLALVVSALVITGCGGERALSHGMYEGLKTRERVLHPQEASTSEELPDYSRYQAERKRVLGDPPGPIFTPGVFHPAATLPRSSAGGDGAHTPCAPPAC